MIEAAEYQAVTPHVFSWQAYDPGVKCELSSVALRTDVGLVFVDPIALNVDALQQLTKEAMPRAIVLTSANHERAAEKFRAQFSIEVWASTDAATEMEISVDRTLAEGKEGPGGLKVVALPSAGPGEIALVGADVACVGDAVIHLPSHGFSLLPAKYCVDAHRLPNDLRKLLSYEFRILTFAHGDPLVEHARERLQQIIE